MWEPSVLKEVSQHLRGTLCVVEFDGLPFVPKRLFYVIGVPKGETRGGHAHYSNKQFLICVQGQILVTLFDGLDTITIQMSPGKVVFIDKMIWDTQTFDTVDAVLLVLCSQSYDPRDYVNDMEEFKKEVKNGKKN